MHILNVNPNTGNLRRIHCYYHINPQTGNDGVENRLMEYYEIYVMRIRRLCRERGIAINKLATMSDVKQSTLDNIVRGITKNPRVKSSEESRKIQE